MQTEKKKKENTTATLGKDEKLKDITSASQDSLSSCVRSSNNQLSSTSSSVSNHKLEKSRFRKSFFVEKSKYFEVFHSLVVHNPGWFRRWIQGFLEVIFFIHVVLVSFDRQVHTEGNGDENNDLIRAVSTVFIWIRLLSDPTAIASLTEHYFVYVVIFCMSSCMLYGIIILFVIIWRKVLSTGTASVTLISFVSIIIKLFGSALMIPLLRIFASTMRIDFYHSTWNLENSPAHDNLEKIFGSVLHSDVQGGYHDEGTGWNILYFPPLLFLCIGAINIFIIIIFVFISDIPSRLLPTSHWSATPNPFLVSIMKLFFILSVILIEINFLLHSIIFYIILFVCSIILLVVQLRYFFYYRRIFVYLLILTTCLCSQFYFFQIFFDKTMINPWYFVSFSYFPAIIIISFGVMTIKYVAFGIVFSKKGRFVKLSPFWMYFPSDVSVASVLHKKQEGIFEFYIECKFIESPSLQLYRIAEEIDLERHGRSKMMLKQIEMIQETKNRFNILDEFIFYHYFRIVKSSDAIGNNNLNEDISKKLIKIHQLESSLKLYVFDFWDNMALNDKKNINMNHIGELITTIEYNQEHLNDIYKDLVKNCKSPSILRKYAQYLMKFQRNNKLGMYYMEKATQLEEESLLPYEIQEEVEIDVFSEMDSESEKHASPTPMAKDNNFISPTAKTKSRSRSSSLSFSPQSKVSPEQTENDDLNSMKSSERLQEHSKTISSQIEEGGKKVFIVNVLKWFIWGIVLFSVGSVILGIGVFVSLEINKTKTVNQMVEYSKLCDILMDVGIYLRRIHFSNYTTADDYERDTDYYRARLNRTCKEGKELFSSFRYTFSTRLIKTWREFKIERVDEDIYDVPVLSLFDSVVKYFSDCEDLLSLSNEELLDKAIKRNPEFSYVTQYAFRIFHAAEDLFLELFYLTIEPTYIKYSLIGVIVGWAVLFVIFLLLVLWTRYYFRRTLASLFLLPIEKIINVRDSFREYIQLKSYSSHYLEIQIINQLCLRGIIYFIMMFIVMICFLVVNTSAQFSHNSDRYIYTHLTTDIQIAHSFTGELKFFDNEAPVLVPKDRCLYMIDKEVTGTIYYYNRMRFGGHIAKLGDSTLSYTDTLFRELYNGDSCTGEETEFFDKLNCKSLDEKIKIFVFESNKIVNGFNTSVDLYNAYKTVYYLNDKNMTTKGAFEKEYKQMIKMSKEHVNHIGLQLYNFVGLSVFLSVPFLLIGVVLLKNIPRELLRTILRIKKMFLFLDDETLSKGAINLFLTNQKGISKSLSLNEAQKTNQLFSLFDGLKHGVFVFDNKFRVVQYNSVFSECFGTNKTILNFISPKSRQKIIEIVRSRKKKKSFCGELEVISQVKTKFSIMADISKKDDMYVCMFNTIGANEQKGILIERLLANIIPKCLVKKYNFQRKDWDINVLKEIKGYNCVHKQATPFFVDLVNFTNYTESFDSEQLLNLLNRFFYILDDLCESSDGIEKIKTLGDGWLGVAGAPIYTPDHAHKAMKFAINVFEMISNVNYGQEDKMRIRIGMSSGQIISGVVGNQKMAFDIWGNAVNEASRMEEYGIIDKIQVSRSTYEYVYDKFEFQERTINVKGKGILRCYLFSPNNDVDSCEFSSFVDESKQRNKKTMEEVDKGE